jgi:hypothetical protein
MCRGIQIVTCFLLLLIAGRLPAQRVLYCSPDQDRFVDQREVAGMAGDHYFVETTRRMGRVRRRDHGLSRDHAQHDLEVYDERMNLVGAVSALPVTDTTLKEYFISGDDHFDQLMLLAGNKRTILSARRYGIDGSVGCTQAGLRVALPDGGREIGHFPFNEDAGSFLMIRSEDRTKILVLGFESVPSSPPKLHALLFDQDWRMLYYRVYSHPFITQPLIQDDFTCWPIEPFDNAPVRLANDGQWLMLSPSRTNKNYLLFHFCAAPDCLSYKEIDLPSAGTMEDLALSLDSEKGEAFAGILSRFHYTTLKDVHVAHYSMGRRTMDFDSSYRFNTLASGKVINGNLVKENFMAVPGRGFMLMKEYGRIFSDWYGDGMDDNRWDPSVLFAENAIPDTLTILPAIRDGYARLPILAGSAGEHERGDLSLYYLPGERGDSVWSGMISKQQTTEMNAPALSYLALAIRGKLFFLYNSLFSDDDEYGSATVMDGRGNLLPDGGPVFWKFKITLDFQAARRISENEVAVPYAATQRKGFAIIRF